MKNPTEVERKYVEIVESGDDGGRENDDLPRVRLDAIRWRKQFGMEYGGLFPKILAFGRAGSARILTAKIISRTLEVPLARIRMEKVLSDFSAEGGIDEKFRQALEETEELAPCLLYVENFEKICNDSRNGETYKMFIQWMNKCPRPVGTFIFSTDPESLTATFFQRGRMDRYYKTDPDGDSFMDEELAKKVVNVHSDPSEREIEKTVKNTEFEGEDSFQ